MTTKTFDYGRRRRAGSELLIQRRGAGHGDLIRKGARAGLAQPRQYGTAHPVVYVLRSRAPVGHLSGRGWGNTTSPTSNKKLIRSYAYNAYGEIETVTDNTSFLTGGTLTTELAYTFNAFDLPVKPGHAEADEKRIRALAPGSPQSASGIWSGKGSACGGSGSACRSSAAQNQGRSDRRARSRANSP